jgi:hypothetical protein
VAQVPAGSAKPKLILHFDVNETIMLGDPAGGDTLVDSLNKIVCKNAYVLGSDGNPSNSLPTYWYDGSHINSNPPPLFTGWSIPQGAVAYYRAGRAVDPYKKTFTENGAPGEAYRFAYNDMKAALLWPTGKDSTSPDNRLCHDGVHHFLIPAFFHTISTLAQQGRSFGVVIRTFGSDADDVAHAINAFAEGKHLSSIPPVDVMKMDVSTNVWHGSYAENGQFRLRRGQDELCEVEALKLLEARDQHISCVVCTDDYKWWSKHDAHPSAGKPVWITQDDPACHHIFFDDNIHARENDSIVAVRVRESADHPFRAMSGAETLLEQGVHLVRTPTIEPILNHAWFLEQIAKCETAFAARSANSQRSTG